MIEYYGWINIRESYRESDEDDILRSRIVSEIREEISQAQYGLMDISIGYFNGMPIMSIVGAGNHRGSDWEFVENIVKFTASRAKGSYGIVYFFDDEDQRGNNSCFQVLVIKKGRVSAQEDPFLSPYWPEVEELE